MPRTIDVNPTQPVRHGYGLALQAAFRETSVQVQDMHRAIASSTFSVLTRIPLLATPAKLIQRLHDKVVDGSYAAVRQTGQVVLTAATALERRAGPTQRFGALESALNGVFGDFLLTSNNPLAARMGFYANDQPLAMTAEAIHAACGDVTGKVVIFIHGLCLDEHCWAVAKPDPTQCDFGLCLRDEAGFTPFYLRYNTGLGLDVNGAEFATQLDALVGAYPVPIESLVLIGHSMGGLVARTACDVAANQRLAWLDLAQMVICLGSPNAGSNLEKLGQLTTAGLHRFAITRPLGKLAEGRSTGIKHLRHGLHAAETRQTAAPHLAYRFVGAGLTKRLDHPLSRLVGDGLVTFDSATAPNLHGNVKATRLGGLSHIGLLTSQVVYQQISDWLAEPPVAIRS